MQLNYAIGIDLGTTYSCIGIFKDGKIEIIPNEDGARTTPSYVSFINDEIIVGDIAKINILNNNYSESTIYDSKRLIGKNLSDVDIQKDMKHYPFKLINDENDRVMIMVNNKKMYPEEISSLILKKLKKSAELYLGTEIINAVITVPAYFNDKQRYATKFAAELAGLNVLRIINEPTASAIAYGLDKIDSISKIILVFDLGGGTLDVSILHINNGVFEVKATSGNTHLGGEDFDNKIVEYLILEFSKKNKLQSSQIMEILQNAKLKNKLKKEAENAKKILSSLMQTNIHIDVFYNNIDLDTTLSRMKFENLCDSLFKKCIIPIENALYSIGIDKNKIDDIILVGGSTRIPKIKLLLKDFFGKDAKDNMNPDEAVAMGASIQAAILSKIDDKNINSIILIDVIPLSLGIETSGGIMTVLIPKNSTIPCEVEKIFSTFSDNQPSVTIKIYEGERALVKDNNLLGIFELIGIQPALRGIPRIKIKFKIDANGLLNVSAVDESIGIYEKIIINNSNNLSKESLAEIYDNAEKYMEVDKNVKELFKNKQMFENLISNSRNLIGNYEFKSKIGENNYEELNNILIKYTDWFNNNMNSLNISKEDYANKYKEAENDIMSIIKKIS